MTGRPRISIALLMMVSCIIPPAAGQSGRGEITLGFVGDIMVHNSQLRRAWKGTDAAGEDLGYDFHPSFEWFAPYLGIPDFTAGNLETTFGGPDSAWIADEAYAFRGYQAFPTFTTPDEMAAALKSAGFDLLITANNHCMDSRLEGAARTLKVLNDAQLAAAGTAAEGRPVPWRGRIGGWDVSLLAWTASVNGLIAPEGMDVVNVFNARGKDDRLDDMLADIRAEAARVPDLVILFIHWGQEYFQEPDQYQKNLAALAAEAGADIIIGSHPHVLQPVERRVVDGPRGPREVFIAWSLGNFISSQKHIEGEREWVDGSAMLNLTVRRNDTGGARVSQMSFVPFYVRWSDQDIRVLAVADGLKSGGAEIYGLSEYDMERLNALDLQIPSQITSYLGGTAARRDGALWRVDFSD